MYALMAMFLLVPLYFSHLFAPLGFVIGDVSSFERQKGYLAGILLIIALLEIIIFHPKRCMDAIMTHGKWVLIFLSLPFIAFGLFQPDLIMFFIGSNEKNHGYYWYAGLIMLAFIFQVLTSKERKQVMHASMFGASFVALFALIEWVLGGSPFFESLQRAAWGELRSVSTLGNPNYVAGYLLAHLPFLSYIRIPQRYIITGIILLGILSTGSYIGIGLSICYFGVLLLRKYFSFRTSLFIAGTAIIVGICIAPYLLSPEKMLSFESRYILIQEVASQFAVTPIIAFIGSTPESIIQYFDGARSDTINQYFPATSAIDSSHNIFLDYVFQYGFISALLVVFLALRRYKKLPSESQLGIIVVLVFLSLNVPITLHIMMLILLFQSFEKEL